MKERTLVTELVAVAAKTKNVKPRLVLSRYRGRDVTAARYGCFSELRRRGFTVKQIGRAFGRDHTTVCHGSIKFAAEVEMYEDAALLAANLAEVAGGDMLPL